MLTFLCQRLSISRYLRLVTAGSHHVGFFRVVRFWGYRSFCSLWVYPFFCYFSWGCLYPFFAVSRWRGARVRTVSLSCVSTLCLAFIWSAYFCIPDVRIVYLPHRGAWSQASGLFLSGAVIASMPFPVSSIVVVPYPDFLMVSQREWDPVPIRILSTHPLCPMWPFSGVLNESSFQVPVP